MNPTDPDHAHADPAAHDESAGPSQPGVWRTTPRGPSTLDVFHAVIREVHQPLRCIQCLWLKEPAGYGLEFTAFFEGDGCYSALLLGGIHGDAERRVMGGSCPPFLEVSFAKSVGAELANLCGAEFYFPCGEHPTDRLPSWLDMPATRGLADGDPVADWVR